MPKKILTTLIIVVVGSIVFLIWGGIWSNKKVNSGLENFAHCLADKEITMFGMPSCSWCQKQKALFGEAFQFVSYIDCSKNPQECVSKGINATPTWVFSENDKIESYLTLEQLAEVSGCELPK
jgi:glutaredoxin